MNNKNLNQINISIIVFIISSTLGLLFSTAINASEDKHGDEPAHEIELVLMADSLAQKMGVKTKSVQPGSLEVSARLYGSIVTDPASLSHVRARFDGIVTKVNANLGKKVEKGETLAVV